jgi:hypothetical protein
MNRSNLMAMPRYKRSPQILVKYCRFQKFPGKGLNSLKYSRVEPELG